MVCSGFIVGEVSVDEYGRLCAKEMVSITNATDSRLCLR
jgi:hypothetical protein